MLGLSGTSSQIVFVYLYRVFFTGTRAKQTFATIFVETSFIRQDNPSSIGGSVILFDVDGF